jgi:hypothetical protein
MTSTQTNGTSTNGNGKRIGVAAESGASTQHIVITAPRMMVAEFTCASTAPLCLNRFAIKAQVQMQAVQAAGSQAKSKKVREAKDFDALYKAASYRCGEWYGVHAAALRLGMIDACRLVGFKMTLGKMAVRVLHDGLDDLDGTPLVRIYGDPPVRDIRHVRNATGVIDLRARPLWREWSIKPRIEYDADQFSLIDVTNLLARVGKQIGIGEGRPYSRQSAGLGFGLFDVAGGR